MSSGTYIMSKLYLKSYKKDFKSYVFKNKKIISFTKIEIRKKQLYQNSKNLVWEDENKEIVYFGNLYDIVSIDINDENVVLTVVSDKKELELKKQFASIYTDENYKNSSQPIKLLKQLLSLKCIFSNTDYHFKCLNNDITFCSTKVFNIQKGYVTNENPPPSFS